MEIASLVVPSIGTAAAKWLLQAAFKDSEGANLLALELLDGIRARFTNYLVQRQMLRTFDQIAEEIAEKLTPMFDRNGLSTDRCKQISLDVARAIELAPPSSDFFLENALNTTALEHALITAMSSDLRTYSAAETAFTKRLIAECATYLLELAWTLPDFRIQLEQDRIERESEILAIVRDILGRLPQPDQVNRTEEDEYTQFELKYRRSIAVLLDNLELFGIRLPRHIRRYNLSIAYISLGLNLTVASRDRADNTKGTRSGSKARESIGTVETHDILARFPRLLIRGEPGSGKTTLLQWVAVQAARRDQDADPAWRELIPLFVWLRRYGSGRFPSPAQIVRETCGNIIDEMPQSWANRILRSGRALVLIDGVDELPDHTRESVVTWLEGFLKDFPNCRIIITSRSVSVKSDWLTYLNFDSAEILPMNRSRIPVFLAHWHRAISSTSKDSAEVAIVDRAEYSLRAALKNHRDLQSLAQSPLLCAMLCAMNIQLGGQLPRNRMDLYRTALDMLLERRDLERQISHGRAISLSRDDKEALVGQLAYWMFGNELISVPRKRFLRRIEALIKRMPHVEGSAEDILWYIHHRTGLLRETVLDHFDFAHLTFQEFLAAKEAVSEDDIDILVLNAPSPKWHNVIPFAAGHCTYEQRERLIAGLLSRGEEQRSLRGQLLLLAISCRETSTVLPIELQERLSSVIGELLPPKSNDEARLLAQGGKLAIPFLRDTDKWDSEYAPYIIRALGQIDDEESLSLIQKYAAGKGESVIEAVMDVWGYFPYQEFGSKVVKTLNFDGWFAFEGYLDEHDPTYLSEVTQCSIKNVSNIRDLMYIRPMQKLLKLDIDGCDNLESFRGLGRLSQLTSLEVRGCGRLTDAGAARALSSLEELRIVECPMLQSVSFLHDLRSLQCVELTGLDIAEDFSALSQLRNLTSLRIAHCHGLSSLAWIWPLKMLRSVNLDGCFSVHDVEYLESLPELEYLVVADNSIRDRLSPAFQERVEVE